MTREPEILLSTVEPEEALKFFMEKRVTSVPVLSPSGGVVGMLTDMIMVKIIIQHRQTKKVEKIGNYAAQFLPAVFVAKDATMPEIVKGMVQSATQRVLVHDATGKMVGLISPKDLLKILAGNTS